MGPADVSGTTSRPASSVRSMSTQSSRSALTAYFPQAEGSATWLGSRRLPPRPFRGDLDLCPQPSKPIAGFDEHKHNASYAPRPDGIDADLPPPRPDDFSDPYLLPSLTRNERLRLTMLWYHTNGVFEDEDFLRRLQEQLDLVQTFMGWEYAIMGLVSEDIFTRVATAGLPLAIVPRRDSPCSHTINQDPGSVFMLPNMASDWRFKQMPCVSEDNGLRSYAGAQIRCKAPNGEVFALGSLCVASGEEHPPLTAAQQNALVRFADLLSADIINHSRDRRRRQRHYMDQLLAERRTDDPETNEDHVLDLLRIVYPKASIAIHESSDGTLPLPNHTPISILDITEGLWEDSELIDELIETRNNNKLETARTVRAIVCPCQTYPVVKYLVVASNQVQLVFDDVDAVFVDKCAVSLTKIIQGGSLRDALKAKDEFLRGVTHQLRTPIHGILGSCELLAEELANCKFVQNNPSHAPGIHPSSIIKTIKDSGRELMSTVNNMLKLNRFIHQAEIGLSRMTFGLQGLTQIEADIMYEVNQAIPEAELVNVPIFFENRLSDDDNLTTMDLSLLKECIQSLILNSLFYTKQGAVIIVIAVPPDRSRLTFDVIDTGCGIAQEDKGRVFEAFEKVDSFSRGAGLGLTLAAKIAALMDGSVSLVASSQEPGQHGSHFRAEFRNPSFACTITRTLPFESSLHNIPRTFCVLRAAGQRPELVSHFASYLEHRGFTQVRSPKGSFTVVTYTPDTDAFHNLIKLVDPRQISICLVPAGATHPYDELYTDRVRFHSGPFLTSRLQEILKDIDRVYLTTALLSERAGSLQLSKDDLCMISELSIKPLKPEVNPVALLVDDNVVNLRILRMYCEKRHIPYTTAVNGQEAVDEFSASLEKDQPINLVLMDLQMPVLDGVAATQQIREIEKHLVPVRMPSHIFMITGQDSPEDKTRSFAAGADEFYVKPTGIRALDRGIGKYFPKFEEMVSALKLIGK